MSIAAATRRDSLPRPPETDSVGFVILLADHDEPLLAAKKKQRRSASSTPTSTPKNRVWGFDDDSLGRPCSGHELSWETAIGSVQYSYENASGRANYYTRDHVGSVRELLNGSGTIVARYSYDPFGRVTLVSGSNLATFQYATLYAHQPSGLDLPTFRGGYDPTVGRWIQRDYMGERGGLNLYGYVGNDPINLIDPLGFGTWTFDTNPKAYPGMSGVDAYYTLDADELKCCKNAVVDRYVIDGLARPFDGDGPPMNMGPRNHNNQVHAQYDAPRGPGYGPWWSPYNYRPPHSERFILQARCTAGPAAGKILSTIRIGVNSGGSWNQGETPTAPYSTTVVTNPGK